MAFPQTGRPVDQVIRDLESKRAGDVRWQDGRAFALGDALLARGWFHDRQGPPDTLHSTVSNSNAGVIDQYLEDLAACVAGIRDKRADDRSTDYATLE